MKKMSKEMWNAIFENSDARYRKRLDYYYYINNTHIHIREMFNAPLFFLLFWPVSIYTFFYCLWDGGLRKFRFPDREYTRYNFFNDSVYYKNAKNYLENKENEKAKNHRRNI